VTANTIDPRSTPSTVDAEVLHWRGWVPKTLLVVFCVCMALSSFAIWSRNQISDTDRYVRTVAPLADDPAIQEAIVVGTTNRFASLVDEASTRASLPAPIQYLAAPLRADLINYIEDTTRSIVTSDQFSQYWEEINRAAHPTVSAILTGSSTQNMTTTGGKITLDLAPLVQAVKNQLSQHGVDLFDRLPTGRLDTTVVIFDSPELADVQDGIDLLDSLAIALPIVGLISLGGYLWLAPNRRLGIIWAGLGLAATMTIVLLLLSAARNLYLDGLESDVNRNAAAAFFDTVGHYLRNGIRLLALFGLLVAGAVFATRPGSWLRRGPAAIERQLSHAWEYVAITWRSRETSGAWTQRNLAIILGVLIVACSAAIIWLDRSTLGWVITILLIAAVGMIITKLLAFSSTAQPIPAAVGIPGGMGEPARTSPGGNRPAIVAPANAPREHQVDASEAAQEALLAIARDLSVDDQKVLQRFAIVLRDTGSSQLRAQR
jgi:hypothetical protein